MAEKPAGESHIQEIIDSMLGDMASGVAKHALGAIFGGIFSPAGDPWKRRFGAMALGTPHTDEQIYWAALKRAEGIVTPEKVDKYLIELAKLPVEKQNVHEENTIQTWMMEFEKTGGLKEMPAKDMIELVIETSAQVIANHAERIARNPEAWIAMTKIQDIDKPILGKDYAKENEKLRARIQELREGEARFFRNLNPINRLSRRPSKRTV